MRRDARSRPERLAMFGLLANVGLALTKLTAGVLGQSFALVADAVESLVDIVGSAVVWGALRYGGKPPDDEHPFGHGKIEALAAMAVALLVFGAGFGIAIESVRRLVSVGDGATLPQPAWFTLVVLVVVVAVKETLYRMQRRASRGASSAAGAADAWHHRSDAITSAFALLGIALAVFGGSRFAWADAAAALIAGGVVIVNGALMVREPYAELMDRHSPTVARHVSGLAMGVPGIRAIERCEVRRSGRGYRVVMHAEVDGGMTVSESHSLTGVIKQRVRDERGDVDSVLIHIEPHEADERSARA